MAKLIKEIDGVLPSAVYPVTLPAGAECPPELEDAAIALGALSDEDTAAVAERRRAEAEAAVKAIAEAEETAKAAADADAAEKTAPAHDEPRKAK